MLRDDGFAQFGEEMYPSFDEPGQIRSRANKQPDAETTAAPIKDKRSAVTEEGQFHRIIPHREVPLAKSDYFVQNRSAHQIARKLTNLQPTARSSDSSVKNVQKEANRSIYDKLTRASPKHKALADDSGIENNKKLYERSRDAPCRGRRESNGLQSEHKRTAGNELIKSSDVVVPRRCGRIDGENEIREPGCGGHSYDENEAPGDELMGELPSLAMRSGDKGARDRSVYYSSKHSACPPALKAKLGIEGDELMGTKPTYSKKFRRDADGNIVLDKSNLKVNEQNVKHSQVNSESEKSDKNNINGLQKLAAVALIANMIGTFSRDKKVRTPQTENYPDSDGDEDVPELEELDTRSNDEISTVLVDAGKGISALLLYSWL